MSIRLEGLVSNCGDLPEAWAGQAGSEAVERGGVEGTSGTYLTHRTVWFL